MIMPAKKMEKLATSVFTDLAEKKQQKLLEGIHMIDLSIGSPDLAPPKFVMETLAEEVLKPNNYGYAITSTKEFQEAVAYFYKNRYDISIQPNEVLQLLGSQDGLAHISLAYLDEDDIIIAPNPGYPIYLATSYIASANLYLVPVNEENHFQPNLDDIPDEVKKRAKLFIVNYPGNPTSALASEEYFEKLIQFGIENDILIVHDFAYSELIFDNKKPLSIFSVKDAKKTAVEFNSLSKSFNVAGMRIGYLIGDPKFLQPLANLKSHLDYGVFLPIQKAASVALTSDYSFLEKQRQTFEARRNLFISELRNNGISVRMPDGGMFVWLKIPSHVTSLQFALKAIDYGVVITPGHAFGDGGEGYVRIALVQNDDELIKGAKRLVRLIKDIETN